LERWIRANQRAIVEELVDLLSIPNVTADRPNIEKNAAFLQSMLVRRGLRAEILSTPGNPIVWGELRATPRAATTVLFYCHCDGQPVDPAAWAQRDPFAPVLRTGRHDEGAREIESIRNQAQYSDDWRLYARSAATSKAPIVALMGALDALRDIGLEPSVNVRVIIDGEEEVSSPSLLPALEAYRDRMASDCMLILAGPMHFTNRPTIVFGARGIQKAQLTVYGPKHGAHSGHYGNWLPNPALRLAQLVASMKDDDGNVLVADFYKDAIPLSADEERRIAAVPSDDARLLRVFGVAGPEKAGLSLQMALQRPALNVRGLQSAFVGSSAVTIIPDRAIAELDIRLVQGTSGPRMLERLREHIRRQGYYLADADPSDEERARHTHIAKLTSSRTVATEPFRTSLEDRLARRVIAAIARGFGGDPPICIPTLGGTVPAARFIETFGFPAMVVPIVNLDNNQHAANENVRLGNLFQGIVICSALLQI
jgi:acetylornithine deacetylase/succinyl-diaminopimelate desuccinylase-like protein